MGLYYRDIWRIGLTGHYLALDDTTLDYEFVYYSITCIAGTSERFGDAQVTAVTLVVISVLIYLLNYVSR